MRLKEKIRKAIIDAFKTDRPRKKKREKKDDDSDKNQFNFFGPGSIMSLM